LYTRLAIAMPPLVRPDPLTARWRVGDASGTTVSRGGGAAVLHVPDDFLYVPTLSEKGLRVRPLPPEPRGGRADEPSEVAGQVGLVGEPAGSGHHAHGQVGPGEERFGLLGSLPDHVLVGGEAGGPLEQLGKVVRAEAGRGCHSGEGGLSSEVVTYVVEGLLEGVSREAALGLASGLLPGTPSEKSARAADGRPGRSPKTRRRACRPEQYRPPPAPP
jgi:hypothetical protein